MNDVLFAAWFFAPAAFANMAPIFANNIPHITHWKPPLDFNKTFRGKRIFGSHKTFRGLAAGVAAGTMIGAMQFILATSFPSIAKITELVDYTSPVVIALGAAIGFGALFGDAVKSFFKRQIGVTPGKNWVPFDQTDFILGGLLFSLPFAELGYTTYGIIFVVATLLHPIINIIGWMLHMKDTPF